MLLRRITSNDEIHLCQLLLREKLKKGGYEEIIVNQFGPPQDKFTTKLLWNKEKNIWYFCKKLDKYNKYWNTFGIGKPTDGMFTKCEINPPIYGDSKQGIYAKDGDRLYFLHRGTKMGGQGNTTEVIRNHFKSFGHKMLKLEGNDVLLVGEMTSENFLEQLHTFVKRRYEL